MKRRTKKRRAFDHGDKLLRQMELNGFRVVVSDGTKPPKIKLAKGAGHAKLFCALVRQYLVDNGQRADVERIEAEGENLNHSFEACVLELANSGRLLIEINKPGTLNKATTRIIEERGGVR